MNTTNLVAWLPFDDSTTEDLCGNTWTAYGNPTIGTNGAISGNALQLNGSSYLQKSGSISLGGQDFTIRGEFNLSSSSGSYCRIFSFHNANSTTENCINIARNGASSNLYTDCMGSSSSKFAVTLNESHYFAYVYQHDEGKVKIFIDGKLKLNWSRTIARTTFPNVFIGKSNFNADGYPVGSIDEFQIYDGVALHTENFTPPTENDYIALALEIDGSALITFYCDVERFVKNNTLFLSSIKVYLPFDNSPIEDLCGNEWNIIGLPSIDNTGSINDKSLQLNGSSCLKLNGSLSLGGKDFTICGWATMNSSAQSWGGLFALNGNSLRLIRYSTENSAFERGYKSNLSKISVSPALTNRFHFEIDYVHSTGKWYTFFNGVLKLTYTNSLNLTTYTNVFVGGNGDNSSTGGKLWGGSIDEFQIYDGIALHTENFTPPTAEDYFEQQFALTGSVNISFDIERVIKNNTLLLSSLKVWLPFDSSTIEDLCGNTWTAYDSPTIEDDALKLNGSSQYLLSEMELGSQDFTISCYENKTGGGRDGAVFVLYYDESHFMTLNNSGCWFINYSGTNTMPTGLNHVEFNYVHSEQKIYYFVNGLLVNSRSTDIFAQRRIYKIALGCGLWGTGVNNSANYWAGTINEFQIYDGVALHAENFTPPSDSDYSELKNALGESVSYTFDVERVITNSRFISVNRSFDAVRIVRVIVTFYLDTKCEIVNKLFLLNCLKVWLPFNSSVTEDLCDNEWTTSGTPTIAATNAINGNALQLDGLSYLQTTNIELGGQDFTICGYCYTSPDCTGGARVFNVHLPPDTGMVLVQLRHPYGDSSKWRLGTNSAANSSSTSLNITDSNVNPMGERHYFEVVYQYAAKTMTFYIDGVQKVRQTNCPQFTRQKFMVDIGTQKYASSEEYPFTGSIDEFQIYDGIALHTENFDVPEAIDYVDLGVNLFNHSVLVLYVDVARQNISGIVECVHDISRTLTNTIYHPSFNGLKAYLPFDNSVTEDLCGNEWTTYGNPTISTNRAFNFNALQLDGSSYLKLTGIKFGGRNFCIDCWVNVDSSTPNFGYVLSIVNPSTGYPFVLIRKSSSDATKLEFFVNSYADVSQDSGYKMVSTINSIGFRVHVKLLYILSSNVVWLFINDKSAKKLNDCPQYNRQTFDIYVGANSSGGYGLIGTIDELRIYDGTYLQSGNGTPPTFVDYVPIKLAYYGYAKISFNFDVKSSIETFDSIKEYWKYLKVWLPFDNSVTEDLCGNIWSVSGNPTISPTNAISNNALQLDGSSYLLLNNIELGGQDFTIDAYVNMSSSSGSSAEIFSIQDNNGFLTFVCRDSSYFKMWYNVNSDASEWSGYNPSTGAFNINKRVHIELVYYYSSRIMRLFIDGVQILSRSSVPRYTRKNFRVYICNESFIGSIDEFRIFDGIALHNADFTPPSAGDYELFQRYHFVTVVSDVARKINNFIEVFYDVRRLFKWRYENTGIADLLSISGTTLTDLPETQSRTDTAFYQTSREKCFDLPATPEIWLKFDVYFDGSNRWRAYNGGANGITGITAQQTDSDKIISVFSNEKNVQQTYGFSIPKQLQTVLLHMVSGSSAGVVEAWVDGTKIYTYTGNVNKGEDFADIYLQSDGAGTFFSNVIISNYEVGLNETLDGRSVVVLFDVEINIGRLISFYLDVKRIVITQETIEQLSKFASALKVWLPFDTSPIADFCGNEWIDYGNPTIQNKELVLADTSSLEMYPPLIITRGQTFTVGCWFSITVKTTDWKFLLWRLKRSDLTYSCYLYANGDLDFQIGATRTTTTLSGVVDGKKHYLEAVFDSGTSLIITLDGVRVAVITVESPVYLPNYWFDSSVTTLDYKVCVGEYFSGTSRYKSNGTIDEFQIYDGVALHSENFVPPIEASYVALRSKILENSINVMVDVMRLVKDDTCLKVHLTFDEDVTTDECGNEWTAYGHPTISEEHAIKGKALQLDGENYLKCNSTFTIEERQPFTIDCWVHVAQVEQLDEEIYEPILLWSLGYSVEFAFLIDNNAFVDSDKQVYHCAMVSDGINVYKFIDGTLVSCVSLVKDEYAKQYYACQDAELSIGCVWFDDDEHFFVGTIDEFRLIIGDALWTKSFTPSITGEILDWSHEVTLNCDVMYIVNNVEEPWIYYGISVPNRISYGILFKSNLPANVSRIVMRDLEITFPVPTTYNFWIRFDFNPGSVGFFVSQHKSKYYGINCDFDTNTSRTTALLGIICGSYYGDIVQISGNATADESADVLHTVLLHIKSGLTDGIIEAWVDKTKSGKVNYLIERYVGNVNDGVPIYDFIIRSGDHCSNIIISNEPITFDSEIPEAHIIELVLDVECQLTSNFVTYNLDIIRNVIAPIIIPLSEENIEYTLNRIRICSIPQKFILPKISKFYIYGDLVGKVHIYSDTNVEGIINGSYYFTKNSIQSEFIESNEFYIVLDTSIISAQDVIKLFIHKLVTNRLSGTSALNRAVIYATDGRYVSWNNFINQFLNCLNSIDYKRFLDFYCDIVLDNNDTGAILGWDAGGVAVRTAISVVTESSSADAWNIPVLGSSVMIRNLLVHFPRYGVDFNLTNLEKYILSGLNSEWIYRSLELIQYSFGISFEDSDITYEMYIQFSRDSSSNNLAYTSAGENDTSCIVTINMYYYSSMDITDVNGLSEYDNMYLDRTIVHELVHAVMKLRSYAHYTLPNYIIEGLAELVHGIDDYRKNNIVDLLTARKNDLISALTSEQYAYPEDAYSAGYILLRFLAKQGQHINNTSSNKLIINNLLVVNDLSLVIKTVECDVTTAINNYVITQCDVTTAINNYVITQCDVTINHYMIIEYVLDVYCECVVSIVEFISVQINVMYSYIISADVFRRIIGLNVTKFNIMMYGVSNVHINSITFNIVMYGVSSSISSSIKFVIVDPSKTRTKLHQCIKPVVLLMLKPINNTMIADQVSDLALRSTPLYPDRSNKGYNSRG